MNPIKQKFNTYQSNDFFQKSDFKSYIKCNSKLNNALGSWINLVVKVFSLFLKTAFNTFRHRKSYCISLASIVLLANFISQCSLKAPAITFTQTQTASEKQMIGDDKEIEKDGWLISSIKSSSSGSDLWEKDDSSDSTSDKDLIVQLKKVAYLSPEIAEWKDKGMIGESFDGNLKKNPKVPISPSSQVQRVEELLNLVNITRMKIIESKLDKEKKNQANIDLTELRNELLLIHYQNVEPGQYFESSKSVWEKRD